MTKKTTRTRQAAPAASPTPDPQPVPPIVAAAARLADPDESALPGRFLDAYDAIPPVFADALQGSSDTRYGLIRALSGLEAAERDAEADPSLLHVTPSDSYERRHSLARIVAILEDQDPDLVTDFEVPVAAAAFYVGMAFMAYALKGGTR